jgi:hypothetical protein
MMTRARVEKANQSGLRRLAGMRSSRSFRLDRSEQAQFVGLGEARRIHREEDVGRAVRTFVADALKQFVFLGLDAIDLDSGLPREVRVERLVGLVVAGGIEVEYFSCAEAGMADAVARRASSRCG